MLRIGMISFGGYNAALVNDAVVGKRRWLSHEEMDLSISLATLAPGGYSSNLAFEVGRRIHGLSGAIASYLCMCLPGVVIGMTIGAALGGFRGQGVLQGFLTGAEVAAVVLSTSVGLKLWRSSIKGAIDLCLALAAFIATAILHWPLEYTVPVLAVGGCLAKWWRER
jgi:chromate transporter